MNPGGGFVQLRPAGSVPTPQVAAPSPPSPPTPPATPPAEPLTRIDNGIKTLVLICGALLVLAAVALTVASVLHMPVRATLTDQPVDVRVTRPVTFDARHSNAQFMGITANGMLLGARVSDAGELAVRVANDTVISATAEFDMDAFEDVLRPADVLVAVVGDLATGGDAEVVSATAGDHSATWASSRASSMLVLGHAPLHAPGEKVFVLQGAFHAGGPFVDLAYGDVKINGTVILEVAPAYLPYHRVRFAQSGPVAVAAQLRW
jgi:hypothetical protein